MLCIPARFLGFRKSTLSMYSSEQQNDQIQGRIEDFLDGGADFQKNFFQNFQLFFWADQIDFPSSPKAQKGAVLANFYAPQAIKKKHAKNAVFGTFLENFDKKMRFLALVPPQI